MNTAWCDYIIREQTPANIVNRIRSENLVEKVVAHLRSITGVSYVGLSLSDYNSYINTSTTTRIGLVTLNTTTEKLRLDYSEVSIIYTLAVGYHNLLTNITYPNSDTQVPSTVTNNYPILIPDNNQSKTVLSNKVLYFAKITTEKVYELKTLEDLIDIPAEFVTKTEFAVEPANDKLKYFKRFLLSYFGALTRDSITKSIASIVCAYLAAIFSGCTAVIAALALILDIRTPPKYCPRLIYIAYGIGISISVVFVILGLIYILIEFKNLNTYDALGTGAVPYIILGDVMIGIFVVSVMGMIVFPLFMYTLGKSCETVQLRREQREIAKSNVPS